MELEQEVEGDVNFVVCSRFILKWRFRTIWRASSFPGGVQDRLRELLDKQDRGKPLSPEETREAEGLVDLAELLSLLRLRAGRSEKNSGPMG